MTSSRRVCLLVMALLPMIILGDVYMHNFRGSNNRLFNGINPNRLFDSQNNDEGGYNHGYMYYLGGSISSLEWTNQHGAGQNPLLHSEVIIQYMCDDANPGLRDGTVNNRIDPNNPNDITRGYHEPASFYLECAARDRNRGLFIADQNVGNKAINTRQNPNGNAYGTECTEDRDLYPYWHPTPWKDLAILTSNTSRCPYYLAESQNVKNKGHCVLNATQQAAYNANNTVTPKPSNAWVYNQAVNCTAAGFEWVTDGAWGIPPPICTDLPTSRDNHLGNALNYDRDGNLFPGYASMFNLTMPYPTASIGSRCVLRLRYNISTGDFDGWNIDSKSNGANSPIRNNPTVTLYTSGDTGDIKLDLNINTDQFYRTFEDRSHVFELFKPPGDPTCSKIYNLNIRGRRGNIEQTFPSVEYDFVPEHLVISTSDCVHLQWTGSNSNPNDDGQGIARSDRNNFVQLENSLTNIPLHVEDVTFIKSNGAFGLNFHTAVRRLAYLRTEYQNGQPELDDAAPYFDAGLFKLAKGTYNYASTRNNNFSNRSQKGTIVVKNASEGLSWKIILAISVFGAICVAGAVVAWGVYGSSHPDSKLGYSWLETKEFFASIGNH